MAAVLTVPLVIATISFGPSTSAGILKTALIEAGYGMLSEAMIQPSSIATRKLSIHPMT
jgi:hypothetical protein